MDRRGPSSCKRASSAKFLISTARAAALLVFTQDIQLVFADEVDVEVPGDRLPVPTKDPSVAGAVIREERLSAPGLSAGDVLRTQPGITIYDTGGFGALSTASLRAAAPAETPVYLAGVRLNDDVGGTADLSSVPLWLIHRIEVYRSNAPLEGDQLGLGGAIFFEPRLPKGEQAAAGAMAGSFGARAGWADVGLGDERGAALVGVRVEKARNDFPFVNDGGTRFDPTDDRVVRLGNNDAETLEIWGIGSARLGSLGRATLVFNGFEKDQGFVGLRLFPSTAARVGLGRRLLAVSTQVPAGDGGVVVGTTSALVLTHTRYDDPLGEASLGTTSLDFDATRAEDSMSVRIPLSERLTVTPAVRAAIEQSAIDVGGVPGARARRDFARAAAQAEWSFADDVVVRALVSGACHHTVLVGKSPWSLPGDPEGLAGPGPACRPLELSGRAGVQLGAAPLVAFATVGRYARVPTLAELYGISIAVRGNAALLPESGVLAELGARVTPPRKTALGGASLDAFVFVRSSHDFISYQRSSIGYVRPFNIGSARVAGFEVLADYQPLPLVLVELSATGLDPRDTSADRPVNDLLPYQPRLQLASRIELKTAVANDIVRSARASVSYFYQASRYADRAGLIVIPAQGSLDVEAELGLLGHLWLRARVANALDETRFDLVGFPLPGRAAYLSMEAQW